ncbi:MAG TPA: serine/threonine-protein kinase [Pyrinomonadaceae bacterium]|jgi:serine/threonine protein kinase|nr:serine/threonine-protein kinase [Pyrinomonadaceae bacterium]
MATETIIGSYRIEERIGRGGMGVVYRGQHTKLPREVAIKSINPRAGDHDLRHMRHRFEREAFIQSQLDHPGIVKIYDYIVAEQTYYIVMEYVEGRSLAQLLKQEEGRPLACERALNLFDQILTAVTYAHTFTYKDQDGAAHRGIIHRDLKPPNILVTPDDKIKITDFGIVKVVGSETTDTFGGGYGSPRYVSPEQAEGLEVDQRSDIYSLGVILYEMLTGAPPFGNEREPLTRTEILRAHVEQPPPLPTEINPLIPLEVESIILCALEKDPEGRYATATEFLRAIRTARERDVSDVVEAAEAPPVTYRPVGTHELHETADNTVRQDYITQPIRSGSCAVCGTEAQADEEYCLACGAELGASPATTRLAHRKTKTQVTEQRGKLQRSQRGKWVVIGLIALALLTGVLIYVRFTREAERRAAARLKQAAAPQVAAPPSMQTPPKPSPSLVELGASRVAVDSSYDGYTAKPLSDGVIDVKRISGMRYNEGNWASSETHEAHWIELQLPKPARVAAVYIYWGFDRDRFVASRRVELQTPDERGQWRTISTIEPGSDYDRTAFEFAPVETPRVRILQPAQQGPRGRPFVMWVREVKVFALGD